jgi:hypothetical protein
MIRWRGNFRVVRANLRMPHEQDPKKRERRDRAIVRMYRDGIKLAVIASEWNLSARGVARHRPGEWDQSAAELERQARPEMLGNARVRPDLQNHCCETRSCIGIEREAVDPSHPSRARSRDRSA